MASSFQGVSIDPVNLKSGALFAAFDPTTSPGTSGYGAVVKTGAGKTGALGSPVLSAPVVASGGTLPPAAYSYRVSAVGTYGEGNPCPAQVANTAGLTLATPVNTAFSTATTGGTLAAGTYYYRVSATDAAGETLASTETSIVVPAGTATNTVTVNWGAVSGATGYRVYGRTSGGELFIAAVGAVTTYTDTGAITPAGALPTSNTATVSTSQVTLTFTAPGGETSGFKVYRNGLHLADVAHGTLTYVDNGSVVPSGSIPSNFPGAHGSAENSAAPRPIDGGGQPREGEGDNLTPTEAGTGLTGR